MSKVVHLDTRRRAACSCPRHLLQALADRTAARLEANDGSLLVPVSDLEDALADIATTIEAAHPPRCTDQRSTR